MSAWAIIYGIIAGILVIWGSCVIALDADQPALAIALLVVASNAVGFAMVLLDERSRRR